MDPIGESRRFSRPWLALSLVCLLVAGWRSAGYYHPDEQFQTLEFAGSKLGLTTPAALPWEHAARMRSWLQPALYVLVLSALRRLSANPFTGAAVLRVLSGLYAWIAVLALARCCQSWFADREAQRTAIRMLCVFCLLPYVMVRTSSESLATSSFLLGLALFETQGDGEASGLGTAFAAGALFGLAFEFRFALGVMVAGWFAWSVAIRRRPLRELLTCALGLACVLALAALVDRWGYGAWSLPPWSYLKQNLGSGIAAQRFGALPVWGYLELVLRTPLGPATGLAAVASAVAWYRHPRHVLTWTGVPMVAAHSLIAHKELRFLFPLLPAAAVSFGLAIAPGRDRLEPLARLARGPSCRWLRRSLFAANGAALLLLCSISFAPRAGLQRFVYQELPHENELLVLGPDTPFGPPGLVGHFFDPPGTSIRILGAPELELALQAPVPCNLVVPGDVRPELLAPRRCRELYRSVPRWLDRVPFAREIDRWLVLRCDGTGAAAAETR